MRITEFPDVANLTDGYNFLIDNDSNGTKKVKSESVASYVKDYISKNMIVGETEAFEVGTTESEAFTVTIPDESRTPIAVIGSLYNSQQNAGEFAVGNYVAGGFTVYMRHSNTDSYPLTWFKLHYIAFFAE